jgi:hypothetical protein
VGACLQINSELEQAVTYIFRLLTVGNRRLNTCTVLSKDIAVPLKIACYQLHNKSQPTLIPNLFEGTLQLASKKKREMKFDLM